MRPTGGSCLGNTFVAEIRRRAADDGRYLLPLAVSVKGAEESE
jgi:hypothetical protein